MRGSYGVKGITVNLAAIHSAEELRAVLRHERAHQLLASAEGQAMLERIARGRLGESGMAMLRRKYARRAGETAESYDQRLREEWLARVAEDEPGVWRRIIEAVRRWLARRGLVDLTDAEIGRTILASLERESSTGNGRGAENLGRAVEERLSLREKVEAQSPRARQARDKAFDMEEARQREMASRKAGQERLRGFAERDYETMSEAELRYLAENGDSHAARLLEQERFSQSERELPARDKPIIELTGPDGKVYRAYFDGWQDFSALGMGNVAQITPLEDLPGAAMKHSTTYGPSLEKKGFKLPEMPGNERESLGEETLPEDAEGRAPRNPQTGPAVNIGEGGESVNPDTDAARESVADEYLPGLAEAGELEEAVNELNAALEREAA